MSRFWALTVDTDTGGPDGPLAAALAGAAVALAGVAGAFAKALWDGFSEQAARKTQQAISDKTGVVFMDGVLTWRGPNVGPS
jgi:hypothetical protein